MKADWLYLAYFSFKEAKYFSEADVVNFDISNYLVQICSGLRQSILDIFKAIYMTIVI